MKLRTSFFELDLPAGSEKITLTDETDANDDCIVVKLKNLGIITLEAIYMSNHSEPFSQVKNALIQDAKSIGAKVTEENSDSSEFSMESGLESEPFIHRHLLTQRKDFVFDTNFFKNFNLEDLSDVRSMMNSIVLLDNPKETSIFVTGERMPMRQVQLTN